MQHVFDIVELTLEGDLAAFVEEQASTRGIPAAGVVALTLTDGLINAGVLAADSLHTGETFLKALAGSVEKGGPMDAADLRRLAEALRFAADFATTSPVPCKVGD
jgi:hypothetical protein